MHSRTIESSVADSATLPLLEGLDVPLAPPRPKRKPLAKPQRGAPPPGQDLLQLPQIVKPRPYQSDAIDKLRRKMQATRIRRYVLGLPTGGGKTIVAAELARLAYNNQQTVCFYTRNIVLCHQASQRFKMCGIPHGILQGSKYRDFSQRVSIINVQSLEAALKEDPDCWQPADLNIIDETHVRSRLLQSILAESNAFVLGLSATPLTIGLGQFYGGIYSIPTDWFFANGFLVRPKFYSDWKDGADPVDEWCRRYKEPWGNRPKTLAFSNRVVDAEILAERFRHQGIAAEVISGKTTAKRRKGILERFSSGETTVLCNVNCLVEGFDEPDVRVLLVDKVVNHPMRSMQLIGRGLRTSEGKTHCDVLDFGGMWPRNRFEIALHYRVGFNKLDIDNERERLKAKRAKPKPVDPEERERRKRRKYNVDAIARFDPGYDIDTQLWPDVCRWSAIRHARPSARKLGETEGKRDFRARATYMDMLGLKKPDVRNLQFAPSETCPMPIFKLCEKEIKRYARAQQRKELYK